MKHIHQIGTMDSSTADDTWLAGRNVTVMGLGSFGGAVGAARFCAEKGAHVTVTDLKSEAELAGSIEPLKGLNIRFVLGHHDMRDFTDADMVVINPAVPRNSEFVTAARSSGAILRTEIGLFVERCPAIVCGITGSNGKTTTVSMIQSILEHSARRYWVGGNIGGSLLSRAAEIAPEDAVILELSSFQLEWLGEMRFSPDIAAVLNITPNHLDRHSSYDEYRDAKALILGHQDSSDTAVLVWDDAGSRSLEGRVKSHLVRVGTALDGDCVTIIGGFVAERSGSQVTPLFEIGRLIVPGRHNLLNALTASACARVMGIGANAVSEGLASFKGVPHRLEFAGELNGVRFYNDSKATTPEASSAGVNAFTCPIVPILGGYDKGVAFDLMAHEIAGNVRWAAVIGATAPVITSALEKAGAPFTVYGSFEDAFRGCVEHARDGDVVLLSPGCASYDMFRNYEERGDIFKRLVQTHCKAGIK